MQSTTQNQQAQEVLLPRREVERRVSLKKTSIYLRIRAGTFPAPVELSQRCVRWREKEIDAWVAARINARKAGA